MPRLALLQFAQKILLRPVKVRLLVHFRAALARRHRERADVNAIGLGALQQCDMPELRRGRFERGHQIAQHQIVGADLVLIAPAVDQIRCLIERGINQVGGALQFGGGAQALRRIGQVDRNVPGAVKLARLATRQRQNVASPDAAEVPQCGISHQSGRARDHHFLVCHSDSNTIFLPSYQTRAGHVSLRLGLWSWKGEIIAQACCTCSQLRMEPEPLIIDPRLVILPAGLKGLISITNRTNGHRRTKTTHQDRCPVVSNQNGRGNT